MFQFTIAHNQQIISLFHSLQVEDRSSLEFHKLKKPFGLEKPTIKQPLSEVLFQNTAAPDCSMKIKGLKFVAVGVLGTISGIIPAALAAPMDPVLAIRTQQVYSVATAFSS